MASLSINVPGEEWRLEELPGDLALLSSQLKLLLCTLVLGVGSQPVGSCRPASVRGEPSGRSGAGVGTGWCLSQADGGAVRSTLAACPPAPPPPQLILFPDPPAVLGAVVLPEILSLSLSHILCFFFKVE